MFGFAAGLQALQFAEDVLQVRLAAARRQDGADLARRRPSGPWRRAGAIMK